MVLGLSIGVTSCTVDEIPAPEIVQNETAYYVIGEVVSNGQPLEGVKVSACACGTGATTGSDGKFELKLAAVGKYAVTFAKDGYVNVSSAVTIASNAKNRTSVAIRQELTKKNAPVAVNPNAARLITEFQLTGNESDDILLDIPSGSVTTATSISMTPFIPGTTSDLGASLVALNLEPDGQTFANPVDLKVKNPMAAAGVRFNKVTHVVEKNGVTQKFNDVTYDAGYYTAKLSGFSNHYFVIGANVSQGSVGTEVLSTEEINNLGSPFSVSQNITVQQKYGWVIDGNLTSSLKSKYNLPDATINALASSFTSATTSVMGSNPGSGELSLTMPFNVSGDMKLTVEIVAQTLSNTFSFPLIFDNGTLDWFEVSVKKYTGTEIRTTYQSGSLHPDHSGGSGS
ncbi:MAG: carboxypeptidase-like regulatory domain-containing protein [Dysgonamonadaceae bacterium]|nr:carboxypeptidase-like regulatory domain-containing protein [Dysgonamonadaceae bacterium]